MEALLFFRRHSWIWVSALLIALSLTGFWMFEFSHFQLVFSIPALIFFGYLFIFQFRRFYYLTIFITPLSISLKDVGGGLGISLPNELMVFAVFLGAVALSIREKLFSRKMLRHPVSILVFLSLGWTFITIFPSESYTVSVKQLIARIVYIFVFFVFSGYLFRKPREIVRFIGLYVAGFVPVMIFSLYQMGKYGFSQIYSPAMSEPFYDDHTIFGACIAMMIPVIIAVRKNFKNGQSILPRFGKWATLLLFLFFFAVLFSYSRAAWLSLIVAFSTWLAFRWRLGPEIIVGGLVILVGTVLLFKEPIYERMASNRSGGNESLIAHAETITDLERDQSNLERINRWSCAVRMYRERPVFGFGPGTYEKNYGSFQVTSQLTRISTFDGDRGDAHSEYLTALSEQGLPGFILFVGLIISLIFTGMRVAYRGSSPEIQTLGLGIFLGMMTYFFHGAVNSFLDLDKAAILFWSFSGMLVALDIYSKPKKEPEIV